MTHQDALDRINTNSYTCAQIVDYLSNMRQGSTSFSEAAESYIADVIKEGRRSTAELYERTCDYFLDFTGRDLMLEGITPRTVKEFDLYLRDRGLNPATRGTYLVRLKAVINRAIRDKKVAYDAHPFEYYEKPESSVRELDISVEDVRLIRDADLPEKNLRVARDLFMLSYYLGGINLVDHES